MLHDVHAGDCVEFAVRPRQAISIKIRAFEISAGRISLGRARNIRGREVEIGPQLEKVAQGLSIRAAQIQQVSVCANLGDEFRARIDPRNTPPVSPVQKCSFRGYTTSVTET